MKSKLIKGDNIITMNEMEEIKEIKSSKSYLTLKISQEIEDLKQWIKLQKKFDKIDNEISKLLEKLPYNTLNYCVVRRIQKWAYNIRCVQEKEITEDIIKEYSNKLKAYQELAEILNNDID